MSEFDKLSDRDEKVSFPGGEAMWVRVIEGDELKMKGVVDNKPLFTHIHGYALGDEVLCQFNSQHQRWEAEARSRN